MSFRQLSVKEVLRKSLSRGDEFMCGMYIISVCFVIRASTPSVFTSIVESVIRNGDVSSGLTFGRKD